MKECKHVKASGGTCEAPALRGQKYCYFHVASRDRIRRQREAAERGLPLQFGTLESAETVQLALTDTVNAMLSGRIDRATASTTINALKVAVVNLQNTDFDSEHSFTTYKPEHDPTIPEVEEALPPKKQAAAVGVAGQAAASGE